MTEPEKPPETPAKKSTGTPKLPIPPGTARTFPESDVWTPPEEIPEKIEIDHPVFRKAKHISIALGAIAVDEQLARVLHEGERMVSELQSRHYLQGGAIFYLGYAAVSRSGGRR